MVTYWPSGHLSLCFWTKEILFHKLVIWCDICFYGKSSQIWWVNILCFKKKREICFTKKYHCYLVKLYSLRTKIETINRVTKESYVFGIFAITDFQGNLKCDLDYLMAWKHFNSFTIFRYGLRHKLNVSQVFPFVSFAILNANIAEAETQKYWSVKVLKELALFDKLYPQYPSVQQGLS